jgi:hypothetical protein
MPLAGTHAVTEITSTSFRSRWRIGEFVMGIRLSSLCNRETVTRARPP